MEPGKPGPHLQGEVRNPEAWAVKQSAWCPVGMGSQGDIGMKGAVDLQELWVALSGRQPGQQGLWAAGQPLSCSRTFGGPLQRASAPRYSSGILPERPFTFPNWHLQHSRTFYGTLSFSSPSKGPLNLKVRAEGAPHPGLEGLGSSWGLLASLCAGQESTSLSLLSPGKKVEEGLRASLQTRQASWMCLLTLG